MHSPERIKNPKLSKNGKKRGRQPLDDRTFTCTVYLDVKTAQWLQRRAHDTRISRSEIMRGLLQAEMRREAAVEMSQSEIRMDLMAGAA
jgi:hypothetical protein